MDATKQIEFWKNSAVEDLEVAQQIFDIGRFRHALFLLHLALEKILKAHFVKARREIPPKMHNLLRLVELSGIELDGGNREFLADVQRFNIEGRYSDDLDIRTSRKETEKYLARTKELAEWLMRRL